MLIAIDRCILHLCCGYECPQSEHGHVRYFHGADSKKGRCLKSLLGFVWQFRGRPTHLSQWSMFIFFLGGMPHFQTRPLNMIYLEDQHSNRWKLVILSVRDTFQLEMDEADRHSHWLVVWNMNGLWLSIQLGRSSYQLTNSIILQRGWVYHQPGQIVWVC